MTVLAKTCAEQRAAADEALRGGRNFLLAACALRLQAAAESCFCFGLSEARPGASPRHLPPHPPPPQSRTRASCALCERGDAGGAAPRGGVYA